MMHVLGEISALWKVSLRFEIAGDDMDTGLGKAAGQRGTIDEELNLEAWQQDLVENLDDQLVLADRETSHRAAETGAPADSSTVGGKRRLYACPTSSGPTAVEQAQFVNKIRSPVVKA